MIHEITHVRIGLEDIHPPEFYALIAENRLYRQLKGEIVNTDGGVGRDKEIPYSDRSIQSADIEVRVKRGEGS